MGGAVKMDRSEARSIFTALAARPLFYVRLAGIFFYNLNGL